MNFDFNKNVLTKQTDKQINISQVDITKAAISIQITLFNESTNQDKISILKTAKTLIDKTIKELT